MFVLSGLCKFEDGTTCYGRVGEVGDMGEGRRQKREVGKPREGGKNGSGLVGQSRELEEGTSPRPEGRMTRARD